MGEDNAQPARRDPRARCELCSLNTSDTAFVPGAGPSKADIVIVGEAPGYQEGRLGVPFTGPSGKLLNAVLGHHGIDRSTCFVTNTVLCRPPSNRTPTKAEIACCWPRLKDDIESRDAKKVIALGNPASQTLLGTKEGVTKTRIGPPKIVDLDDGYIVDVIPTVHPAFCLRMGDSFPHMVTDIGKVHTQAKMGFEPPEFVVYDDDKARDALQELQRSYGDKPIVVDIEVGIDKDSDFGHPEQYGMLCVGFGYKPGRAVVIGEEALKRPDVAYELGRIVTKHPRLVAANGKFDLAGLSRYGWGKLWFDTMLASYALDERTQGVHSLDYLSQELLGYPDYARELHRYVGSGKTKKSYSYAPRPVLYKYNAWDCTAEYGLFELFEPQINQQDLRRFHDHLVFVSNGLMHVENAGIKVDIDYLNEITETYLDILDELERELKPWVNNPRSPQQVKAALMGMGIRNVPSTDVKHLNEFLERYQTNEEIVKFTMTLLKHRTEQKRYGTYVKGVRQRLYEGRIFSTFLLHGSTSRSSSRNPNLQNVPREGPLRRLYVPAEGNVFIQGDYKAGEFRVMAVEARDRFLMDIFLSGRDLHDEVADKFYGKGKWNKAQRVRAKAFNFGVPYGREAYSIAQEYGIPISEAKQRMAELAEIMPEVMKWRDGIKKTVLEDGEDLITPIGRRRRFWLITNENARDVEKEAYSFKPQSILSDCNLHALGKLVEKGIQVRIPIHDANLVECAEEDKYEVAAIVQETMEQAVREIYTEELPFPVDIEWGDSWGTLKKLKKPA